MPSSDSRRVESSGFVCRYAVILLSICFAPVSGAAAQGLLPSTASGWSPFAPRPATAPLTSVGSGVSGFTLVISGGGITGEHGGWTTHVSGLAGAAWYRFTARAVPQNVGSLRQSVSIILRWRGTFGDEVAPDYVWDYQTLADGTLSFDRVLQSPSGTNALDVQLVLQGSPGGQVSFDSLGFAAAPAPATRPVRVAAIYYRPSGTASGLASVQAAGSYAQTVAQKYHPDVMVLGETLNFIGAPGTYESKAETVPGPSTNYMAGIASANRVNIAFGLVEQEAGLLYNTAVLIDRTGTIIGKYRKVQLPLSEASAGLIPGDSIPVFTADFGKVSLLICQDTAFTEAAREASLKGAEMLLVPIWGGKTALTHARAVENGLYIALSGYDYASEVVNPLGTVLAAVTISRTQAPAVAVADIDLTQRFREQFLGDWRDISHKERRATPYQYVIP